MKQMKLILGIIIIALSIFCCSKEKQEGSSKSGKTVTATASVVRHADGTISIESDTKITTEMSKQFEERREIERKYPPDYPSPNSQFFTIREVLSGDTLILDDGTLFKLAGVIAPNKSNTLINKTIQDEFQLSINSILKYELLSREYLQRLLKDEKLAYIELYKTDDKQL